MSLGERDKLSRMTNEELGQLYRDVFETVQGALVLEDLRCRCFAYEPETEGALSDREVFVNIGKRSAVLHIETMMKPEPKKEGS